MGRSVGVECLAEHIDYSTPISSNDIHRQEKGLLSSRNGLQESGCHFCLDIEKRSLRTVFITVDYIVETRVLFRYRG